MQAPPEQHYPEDLALISSMTDRELLESVYLRLMWFERAAESNPMLSAMLRKAR